MRTTQLESAAPRNGSGRAGDSRRQRQLASSHGFTVLELLVAVAIAAILASVAVSSYAGYVTRARLSDAWDGLTNYRLRMEQAYQDAGNYGAGACSMGVPAATKYFTFSCAVANGGMTFVTTATSTAAMPGYAFTVSDDGVQSTTAFPAASGLPASCWLSRVGDC